MVGYRTIKQELQRNIMKGIKVSIYQKYNIVDNELKGLPKQYNKE